MSELYASRPVSLGDGTSVYAVGTDPMNRYVLDSGLIGEHARWWLALQVKYQRWPFWRMAPPPPVTTVAFTAKIRPVDKLVACVLTGWALWQCLKR